MHACIDYLCWLKINRQSKYNFGCKALSEKYYQLELSFHEGFDRMVRVESEPEMTDERNILATKRLGVKGVHSYLPFWEPWRQEQVYIDNQERVQKWRT